MQRLDYQAVLNRVYQHFVIEGHPPGIHDGQSSYHQAGPNGDLPCAIGIFDPDKRLDETGLVGGDVQSVGSLCRRERALMTELFSVDRLSAGDIGFLNEIQIQHDNLAIRFEEPHVRDVFKAKMAAALEGIARDYGLDALAF